jgi:glycine dehydrogenase
MNHPEEAHGSFALRHIGPSPTQRADMLQRVGAATLNALIDEAIPPAIRLDAALDLPRGETEYEFLQRLTHIARRNKTFRSYIGLGYHDTVTPPVVQRLVLENPGWYTPYTPYQAEIAQGRLESLINFQTMVTDLTGMEVANASLLDEATAAAEAMTLLHRVQAGGGNRGRHRFLVSERVWPQTLALLRSRATPLGIEVVIGTSGDLAVDDQTFGLLLQYPDEQGSVDDLTDTVGRAHAAGALVAVGTDLLACALLVPPGEMGADVVFGNSQRFGVPLGYGGPHAAFFATRQAYVRQMPGRIIGVSIDVHGHTAYRMALATREQHIRREKATSNICTAQALLANMAAMYAVYHGAVGLRAIATRVHRSARTIARALRPLGLTPAHERYFDTVRVRVHQGVDGIRTAALARGINFRYVDGTTLDVACNETITPADLRDIIQVFGEGLSLPTGDAVDIAADEAAEDGDALGALRRHSGFLGHPVFHTHRTETAMMRYIRRLERRDIGLDHSMIPLGSCTMKLNAAAEMMPVTWEHFSRVHPFAPVAQAQGYAQVVDELSHALGVITGFPAVSLQPNSGAQGEFAGLLVIRAYHHDRGEGHRDVVLIPASAHGTNPASATMAGLRVVVVATAANGNVDLDDLRKKATEHRARLACLMITYPSTHGVFEDEVRTICAIVHDQGGQVYMDGANMNAQVGLTSPAAIGADVCHLNLHKTFAIPHGGGGPGMGPIAVAAHLAAYLPGHPIVQTGGETAIPPISAAPFGSASILLISYAYIRMLGRDGLTDATRVAILNANYIKARLESHYPVLYARANGRVAHELIFDLRGFKRVGIEEMDVAKRLIDYGFHAPTVSFPVAGTLMVEPTESEDQGELDRFCDAMIQIRREIEDVVQGRADREDNLLKGAPHTAAAVSATEWRHPYTREQAAFPLPFVAANKFWPAVGRIDNPYGDRNLFCSCPPVGE